MKIHELQNQLIKNGWTSSKMHEIVKWQRSNAILLILNQQNKDPLLIQNGEFGFLSNISNCSFNFYRMILYWNNGEEWFFQY